MAPQKCNAHDMTGARDLPSDLSSVRDINAKIAHAYDCVPYDPPASPGLDPAHVFKIAGCAPPLAPDILDLGCGAGAQLERVAELTTGRIVGTDLSRTACDKAIARTARFGDRCEVICADVLDLDADTLGAFDLIYLVGVLYVTPADVQRHLLNLTGRRLKPGGAAVISYYAGTMPLLMAGLHDMLRGAVDPSLTPPAQIQAGRARLRMMSDTLARQPGDHRLMNGILAQVHQTPDAIFFHEMLNQSFGALSTAALQAALTPYGVSFVNWMQPAPFPDAMGAQERAALADAFALAGGGYFYGVFRKD
jgi:SAM-dependent methyltransferase